MASHRLVAAAYPLCYGAESDIEYWCWICRSLSPPTLRLGLAHSLLSLADIHGTYLGS